MENKSMLSIIKVVADNPDEQETADQLAIILNHTFKKKILSELEIEMDFRNGTE